MQQTSAAKHHYHQQRLLDEASPIKYNGGIAIIATLGSRIGDRSTQLKAPDVVPQKGYSKLPFFLRETPLRSKISDHKEKHKFWGKIQPVREYQHTSGHIKENYASYCKDIARFARSVNSITIQIYTNIFIIRFLVSGQ